MGGETGAGDGLCSDMTHASWRGTDGAIAIAKAATLHACVATCAQRMNDKGTCGGTAFGGPCHDAHLERTDAVIERAHRGLAESAANGAPAQLVPGLAAMHGAGGEGSLAGGSARSGLALMPPCLQTATRTLYCGGGPVS